MAYFGRKPKKPGSVPGAASGGSEQEKTAKVRGIARQAARGRLERSLRSNRTNRTERGKR